MDGPLREAVARIAKPGNVIEVRALTDQFTHSGYFNDFDALVRLTEPLDADNSVHGIGSTRSSTLSSIYSRQ